MPMLLPAGQLRAGIALQTLSGRVGALTRTNSEAILGATTFRRGADFTDGVAGFDFLKSRDSELSEHAGLVVG